MNQDFDDLKGSAGGSVSAADLLKEAYERQKHMGMIPRYPVGGALYPNMNDYPVPPRIPSDHEMLCMRMRWLPNAVVTCFDHVAVHSAGEKVFVWVITKDHEPVTIEDEASLYPSDTLITKLRMLQQGS